MNNFKKMKARQLQIIFDDMTPQQAYETAKLEWKEFKVKLDKIKAKQRVKV